MSGAWCGRRDRGALAGAGGGALCFAGLSGRCLLSACRDRAAGAAGAGVARAVARAGGRGLRALAGATARRVLDGVEAHTAGGVVRARTRRARDGVGGQGGGRALPGPPLRRLLPHRPHRAGAGAARGGRLDRRRVHHRQPRPDQLLPHHPRRPHRLRLGRRPHRDGRPPPRPHRARPRGDRPDRRPPLGLLPRPRGPGHNPRLGRPNRRLPNPPPPRPAPARQPRLRRGRLHRQRRRPLPHGRPHPRLPGPRPPRRALPPGLRRPLPAPRPARALPLDRRRGNPSRHQAQGGSRASRAAGPTQSAPCSRGSPS